jgi:hypothetical protein
LPFFISFTYFMADIARLNSYHLGGFDVGTFVVF